MLKCELAKLQSEDSYLLSACQCVYYLQSVKDGLLSFSFHAEILWLWLAQTYHVKYHVDTQHMPKG